MLEYHCLLTENTSEKKASMPCLGQLNLALLAGLSLYSCFVFLHMFFIWFFIGFLTLFFIYVLCMCFFNVCLRGCYIEFCVAMFFIFCVIWCIAWFVIWPFTRFLHVCLICVFDMFFVICFLINIYIYI